MPSRDAILSFLNETLQIERFRDYLPIGLLVEGRDEVKRIATGVSACVELFERARDWKADMVVVHHGMFWDNSSRVVRGGLKQRLKVLLDADMTLAGYHLPLDAHPEFGNNAQIAKGLGLEEIENWGDYHGNLVGMRGHYSEPISIMELASRAEMFFGIAPMVVFPYGPPHIRTVGVVSGGAWDMAEQAVRDGIDCYLTGTADEPVCHLAREEHLNFLAFGHTATERHGVQALGRLLVDTFGVESHFFDIENPL
jgi:dinuclear metal center YbgI/SA1388 family protein